MFAYGNLGNYLDTTLTLPELNLQTYVCDNSICAIYYYLLYFGQNIGFYFSLLIINPFSSFGIVAWIGTLFTVLFGFCLLTWVRG